MASTRVYLRGGGFALVDSERLDVLAGYVWSRDDGKTRRYRSQRLGVHDSPENASRAYDKAARQVHGHFFYKNGDKP